MKRTTFALAAFLGAAAPAAAQLASPIATPSVTTTTTTTTGGGTPIPKLVPQRLVEWDITSLVPEDIVPGSLSVDDRSSSRKSKVWFATRVGLARLYRLTPGTNIYKDYATAKSWDLGAETTGGVRTRHSDDGRFAFVNVNNGPQAPATGGLVAIDTSDDTRVTWIDRPVFLQVSDVSVDTRDGATSVFTAAPVYEPNDFVGKEGVVQRLRPGKPQYVNGTWLVPAEVTRYRVGGGAGTCPEGPTPGTTSPCIPGIAVDRRRGQPIYVSEPDYMDAYGKSVGAIGELDPRPVKCPKDPYATCAALRHWPLPADIGRPRQIRVDDNGRIWGLSVSDTPTGPTPTTVHLFSLTIDRNANRATVTRHDPFSLTSDQYLFAVAPSDGVIGFTDSNENQVSILLPQRTPKQIYPIIDYVEQVTRTLSAPRVGADPRMDQVAPRVADATAQKYTRDGDGTYIETDVMLSTSRSGSPIPSEAPTGIESDGTWRTGAFFYGVALSDGSRRIGHVAVRLNRDADVDCRRGDNDFDHDGIDDDNDDDIDGDGVPNMMDDDNDNDNDPDVVDEDKNDDGIEDKYQHRGQRETKRNDSGTMGPGESREYEMTYDAHTVSMLAIVEAADLTAPLAIDILKDDGTVLVSTPAALGKAVATAPPAVPGVYRVRVRNAGIKSITYKTTLLSAQIPY